MSDADEASPLLLPADTTSMGLALSEMDADGTGAIETFTNPRMRAIDVAGLRLELANDAAVGEIAVETAHSIGARDSVEKMIAHQMALAHRSAFLLGRQLQAALPEAASDDGANLRATRLATAMARIMSAHLEGALALQKLRCGGRQTVVVQHVEVAEGGQAIVAGKMRTGGRRGRADRGRSEK
jgi:hypothetical protein